MRIQSLILIASLAVISGACVSNEEISYQSSIDYAASLSDECSYDDGYVCRSVQEDDFLSVESDQKLIPGAYLAAWQSAYHDFTMLEDLNDEQKKLKHYKLGFSENDSQFIVLFRALLLPDMVDGKPQGIIRPSLGQTTKFWVDKKTLQVADRKYLK